MVKLTLIARIIDGLPLAEGLDSDKDADIEQYKSLAKVRGRSKALNMHEFTSLKQVIFLFTSKMRTTELVQEIWTTASKPATKNDS